MAEEVESLPLEQLIEEQLAILQSENTTPEQIGIAFYRMRQYKPLRDLLDAQKDEIAAKLANPDEIKKLFLELLSNEQRRIKKGIKHPVELDEAISPAEIAARAELFAKAREQIPQAAMQRFEQERKTYARRVAQRWIINTKANIAEQQRILEAVETLPPTATVADTKTVVADKLQALTQENPALARGRTTIAEIIEATPLSEPAHIQQQIIKTILDHPDADQTMLLGLSAQGVDFQRAAQLANLGKVFSADIDPAITFPITDSSGRPIFFRAIAKTPFQKIAAPFLDTAFALVRPDQRPDVIKELFSDSLDRVTQKLGATIVEQPAYKQAIEQANRAFTGRPSYPGGIVTGFGKVVADVGTSVFGSAIDPETIQLFEVEKQITITQRLAWDWRHPYAGIVQAHDPSIFSFAFEGGKWILGFAGKKAGGAAVKKVAGSLATRGIGKVIGGFFGSTLGPIGTVIGSVVGDKIIGGLLRGAGSLLNFAGGFFTRLMSGDTSNLPLPETIMATVVLAPVILISVIPWFGNPQFVGHTAQSFALADTEGGAFAEVARSDLPLSITATGSCPIEGGQIALGSLNRAADTGHGSSSYWGGRTPSYPIPVATMVPSCGGLSCPYYGFAIDVVSPSGPGSPVHVPKICPTGTSSCDDLTWTVTNGWFNCAGQSVPSPAFCGGSSWGYGYIFRANGNGHTWQIYLNHLAPISGIGIGSVFTSGGNNVVGSLATTLSHPHVHIEIDVDGVPVRPESLMCR